MIDRDTLSGYTAKLTTGITTLYAVLLSLGVGGAVGAVGGCGVTAAQQLMLEAVVQNALELMNASTACRFNLTVY